MKDDTLSEEESYDLNRAIIGLSFLYREQQKFAEAEAIYRRVLDSSGRHFKPELDCESGVALRACSNLGGLYLRQGKLTKAENLLQRARRGTKALSGPDGEDATTMILNHGTIYREQGKLAEAEAIYQRALSIYQKTLGPDHALALHTIRCLAAIYNDQGKLDKAADMCKRAPVGFENALGPDHPSTLRTVFILGRLYRKWDKMSEAEALYQRALSGLEKILGPDHSWTRDAIYKLSTLYKNQDRLEETETLCRQALAGYKNPESKYTLNATDGLGIILKRRGKLGEAEIMLHEALSGRKVTLGAHHQLTKATAKELSEVYKEQGRLEEADAVMPSNLTSMVEQGYSHAVAESPIAARVIHRLCFFSYLQSVHHVPSNPRIEDLPYYLP